jgi:23S rRNA (guanosine2251-2'-O)-methyltransferase
MINSAPLSKGKISDDKITDNSEKFSGKDAFKRCGVKLGAQQLRTTKGDSEVIKTLPKNPIYIVLDNVLDTYNIGAIFRLADATACEKVILCGGSETPPHTRIKKASINTTEWVAWSYAPTAVEAIQNLKFRIKNLQVVAVELDERAVPYDKFEYKFPIALVVGHESTGVSEEVLKMADAIVELPMFGVNISLNVMVSLGIVLYEVIEKTKSLHE